ncbi:MAG: hypothetical protein ACTHZ9_04660 [Leucobacter sp.]
MLDALPPKNGVWVGGDIARRIDLGIARAQSLVNGFRGLQAVHADDLGRAYAAAVVARAAGAFNICADDILDPKALAHIIDHGRFIRLPARLVRTLLFGGHAAGLIAADAGWLDMGMSVPLMDNSRAKAKLEWQPRHSAAYALEQLMQGMVAGRGAASLPLSSREPERSRVAAIGEPVDRGAANAVTPRAASLSTSTARDLLDLYLADHLAGATAGAKRIERMAAAYIDTPVYAQLSELADEVRVERAFLKRLIHDLGMKQRRYRQVGSWAAERVGRLMHNGRLPSRSPMTPVLETELMRSALIGKLGVWQTLEDNAEQLGLDSQVFLELADRARYQTDVLSDVHEHFRARAFRDNCETFHPRSPGH